MESNLLSLVNIIRKLKKYRRVSDDKKDLVGREQTRLLISQSIRRLV